MSEQSADYVAPLVLRCRVSYSGHCLILCDGYGWECPPGECDMAEQIDGQENPLAGRVGNHGERVTPQDRGPARGLHNDGSDGS